MHSFAFFFFFSAAYASSRALDKGANTLTTPKDVALRIKPDKDGTSELAFLVYGDKGAEFVMSNDNHGSFRIESGEKLCLEIKTATDEAKQESKSLLQISEVESSLVEGRSLLRAGDLGQKKMREYLGRTAATSRKLLSASTAKKDSDVLLAELVMCPGRFNVTGGYIASTSSGNVKVGGVRQWKMILHEDFHRGTVTDWSNSGDQFPLPDNNGISTCAKTEYPMADYFLGSYANMEAVKMYLLPPHSRVKIKARIHFFDDWNGEIVYLKANGNIIWSKAHRWCSKIITTMCTAGDGSNPDGRTPTISICGNPQFPDTLSVPLEAVISHTGVELELAIGSNVKDGHASWGVDDVQIYIM